MLNRLKQIGGIITIIIVISICATAFANSDLSMKTELGFSNYIENNKVVPFKVDIENIGDDFEGILKIHINYGDSESPSYFEYEQNLNLPQNTSKKIITPVYIQNRLVTESVVKVVRTGGNVELEKRDSWEEDEFENTGYGNIGIIGKSVEAYRLLNGRLIKLENDKFINEEVLDVFEYIILSDEVQELSSNQIEYLQNWSNDGGIFILDDRVEAWAEKNQDILTGEILKFDIDEIISINEYLKNKANLDDSINPIWFSDWYTETIPAKLAPNLGALKIILMIFVVIIGPVNYFVLKKFDRREYLWVSVPILVILFSAMIYKVSSNTELKGPVMSKASYVELIPGSKTSKITSSGSIFATSDNNCKLELPQLVDVDYSEIDRYSFRPDKENIFFSKNLSQDFIEFKNNGFWSPTTLKFEWETDTIGEIKTDLEMKEGKLVGIIRNETGYLLEDLAFVFDKSILFLGDLRVGEEKNIEINLNNGNETQWDKLMMSDIYYSDERDKFIDSQGDDFVDDYERNFLTEDFKQSFSDRFFDREFNSREKTFGKYIIIAWSEANFDFDSKLNGKDMNQINRNMIYTYGPVDVSPGSIVYSSSDLLDISVNNIKNLDYDKRRNYLYGKGSAEIEYKKVTDKVDIKQWQIYLNNRERDYKVNTKVNYSIFNNLTKEWDAIVNEQIFDQSSISAYMNKENIIRIKLESLDDDSISIPEIRVQGVVN